MQIDNALGITYWVNCEFVGTVRLTAHLSDSIRPPMNTDKLIKKAWGCRGCAILPNCPLARTTSVRYFRSNGQRLETRRVSHRTGRFDSTTHRDSSVVPRVCLLLGNQSLLSKLRAGTRSFARQVRPTNGSVVAGARWRSTCGLRGIERSRPENMRNETFVCPAALAQAWPRA